MLSTGRDILFGWARAPSLPAIGRILGIVLDMVLWLTHIGLHIRRAAASWRSPAGPHKGCEHVESAEDKLGTPSSPKYSRAWKVICGTSLD